MSTVKIAGVQMDVALGQVDRNLDSVISALHETAAAGAALTVFPECSLTGYCFESLDEAKQYAEPIDGPAISKLLEVCRQTGAFTVVGMLESEGDRIYNSAALLGPAGVVGVYRKTHLPKLGVDHFVTPGSEPPQVWQVGDLRVGVNICYDGSFPECSRLMALRGADLIVLPTNWPTAAQWFARYVINARALENHVYYMSVDRIGEERDFRFIGLSRICKPTGESMVEANEIDRVILYADIDPETARQKRQVRMPGKHEIDRLNDRRPELYGALVE